MRRLLGFGASIWLMTGTTAVAQDLGDAVGWIEQNGGEVRGRDLQEAPQPDHAALGLINSRHVDRGAGLEGYSCDDTAVDNWATFRTNSNQKWAVRACRELQFERDHLEGYAVMGPAPLTMGQLRPVLERAEAATDVPAALLEVLVRFSSGRRPGLVSDRGHQGLLQLRPASLAELGVAHGDLLDPAENVRAGARYFAALIFRYENLKVALAAFPDGPGVVEAAGGKMPRSRRHRWFAREVAKLYYAVDRPFPTDIGADSMRFVWDWLK